MNFKSKTSFFFNIKNFEPTNKMKIKFPEGLAKVGMLGDFP